MDEKLIKKYLKKNDLKIRSPVCLYHKIIIKKKPSAGLKETSALRKDKKQLKEGKSRKDEEKHLRKRKKITEESCRRDEYHTESRNSKSKNRKSEFEKNSKLPSDRDYTNKQNAIQKVFINQCEQSFSGSNENSPKKKILKVSWSLFGSSQDRKTSTTEEEDVEECGSKRSKKKLKLNTKDTGEYFQECEKSDDTVYGGCSFVESTVNDENDECLDKLNDKVFENKTGNFHVMEVTQSKNNPSVENGVLRDFPAQGIDVARHAEDDRDSKAGNSEDDKETVVFDENEWRRESLRGLKKNQNAGCLSIREHNANDTTTVQRKKRKLLKVKRNRKVKPCVVAMGIKKNFKSKRGGAKYKKNTESSETSSWNKSLMEGVVKEVSDLVKRLHDDYRVILQLINVMPRSGDLADHFKTVILAQKENFRKEIWKNHGTIMRGYDKMMSVFKDPKDVTLEISKRTLLNVEDVHKVISRCILVEDKVKNLKEYNLKATGPTSIQQNGKSTARVESSAESLETTEILEKAKGLEVLMNNSGEARESNAVFNVSRQVSGTTNLRYPYFLIGNPTHYLNAVEKVTSDMLGGKLSGNTRQYNCQTTIPNGFGVAFRSPQATQNPYHLRQHTVDEFFYQSHGGGSTVNYPLNACQQPHDLRIIDPRLRNPVMQAQPVEENLSVPYVCNAVSVVNYSVANKKTFPNFTTERGGAYFRSSPSRCAPRTSTHFAMPSPRLVAPPSQVRLFTTPHSQSRKNLNVTTPGSKDLRISNVTSLPTTIVRSEPVFAQMRRQSIPIVEPNLIRVPRSQPVTGAALPPKKNIQVWGVVPEKPANETRLSSVCRTPKTQLNLKNPDNKDITTTDSGLRVHTSGRGRTTEAIFDPTIPQKLTMRDQRLQAGVVLGKAGGGEEDNECLPTKVLDRVYNETGRAYVCAVDGCKNPGVRVCSMCKSVIYCSDNCQWSYWISKHREECHKLKELRG